jgi:hypothetical protein
VPILEIYFFIYYLYFHILSFFFLLPQILFSLLFYFIHIVIALNAQTKIQYDAMVYLCLSEVLLIFKHE